MSDQPVEYINQREIAEYFFGAHDAQAAKEIQETVVKQRKTLAHVFRFMKGEKSTPLKWTDVPYADGFNGTLQYAVRDGLVHLRGLAQDKDSKAFPKGQFTTVARLPKGSGPPFGVYLACSADFGLFAPTTVVVTDQRQIQVNSFDGKAKRVHLDGIVFAAGTRS